MSNCMCICVEAKDSTGCPPQWLCNLYFETKSLRNLELIDLATLAG